MFANVYTPYIYNINLKEFFLIQKNQSRLNLLKKCIIIYWKVVTNKYFTPYIKCPESFSAFHNVTTNYGYIVFCLITYFVWCSFQKKNAHVLCIQWIKNRNCVHDYIILFLVYSASWNTCLVVGLVLFICLVSI